MRVLLFTIFIFLMMAAQGQNIYSFKIKTIDGNEVSLEQYRGKVLLIVNTASKCGFTPQYKQLEDLYKLYKDKGFEILAFPSNDFAKQEPLNGKEIAAFCSSTYHVTFPVFEKIHVKGNNASELYQFLSSKKLNGRINSIPKWNFHKYLVNKNGEVVDYFYTPTKPTSGKIKKAIEKLLK
ncbi:MAG: glutathione peroxidase [Bacteroidota bacterium]